MFWFIGVNRPTIFLKFPNHDIPYVVTGKRESRDIGLGLQTLVDYFFHGHN